MLRLMGSQLHWSSPRGRIVIRLRRHDGTNTYSKQLGTYHGFSVSHRWCDVSCADAGIGQNSRLEKIRCLTGERAFVIRPQSASRLVKTCIGTTDARQGQLFMPMSAGIRLVTSIPPGWTPSSLSVLVVSLAACSCLQFRDPSAAEE